MLKVHQKVSTLVTDTSQLTWDKVCYHIPVVAMSASDSANINQQCPQDKPWTEPCYPNKWCPFLDSIIERVCWEQSILEVWDYNESIISILSQEDILE